MRINMNLTRLFTLLRRMLRISLPHSLRPMLLTRLAHPLPQMVLTGPFTFVGAFSLLLAMQTYSPAQQTTTALAPAADTAAATKPAKAAPKPAAVKPIKIGSVTFSGSIRARWENTDWYDTDKADGRYNSGAVVLRAGLSQNKEKYDWQVEAEAPLLINLPTTAIAPAPQGQLGLGASYFAANGKQAVEMVAAVPYELVFMDCQMPEMDGLEATAEIRRRQGRGCHTPIIALTASAMKNDQDRCIEAGMDGYMSKPLKFSDIRNALERWLAPPVAEGADEE